MAWLHRRGLFGSLLGVLLEGQLRCVVFGQGDLWEKRHSPFIAGSTASPEWSPWWV